MDGVNRREIVKHGLVGGGVLLLAQTLLAQDGKKGDKPVIPSGLATSGSGRALAKIGTKEAKIESLTEGKASLRTRLTSNPEFMFVDHGMHARGLHLVEFSVPDGTLLVLGEVQEGANAGDAVFSTRGIALRDDAGPSIRCRVYFQIEWSEDAALPCYGRYIRITG